MAHILRLINNLGTLNLMDGTNYKVMDWVPVSAGSADPYVIERIEVDVMGTSKANLQANYQALEKAFERARWGQTHYIGNNYAETNVFLAYMPDGASAGEKYNSDILDGNIELTHSILKPEYWTNNSKIRCVLNVTRRPYWELAGQTSVTVTSPNGTATSGVRLYNCSDANLIMGTPDYLRINWVDIAGTSLPGDIPSPLHLYVENINAAAIGTFDMFVSVNQNSSPGTAQPFPHFFSAALASAYGGGTLVSGTQFANGSAFNLTAGTQWVRWQMSTDEANYNMFQAAARLGTASPAGNYLQVAFADPGGNVTYTGPKNYLGTTACLNFLDAFTVPPNVPTLTINDTAYLYILFGGTGIMTFDYLTLFPLDGWARIYQTAGSFPIQAGAPNDYVIDYNMDETINRQPIAYFNNSAKGHFGNLITRGPGLWASPGQAARIYMLYREGGGTSSIDGKLKFTIYHRPRRLSL